MPHTRQRQIALLMTCTLAIAIVAMTMVPGLGRAQEGMQDETPTPISQEELFAMGEEIYNNTCIACHQAGGTGADSAIAYTYYPPLAGNPYVTLEDPAPVTQTVLFGRAGMPAFRGMSDTEVAAVLTYVRQAWENDASAVSSELVSRVRAEFNVPPQEPATPFPSEPIGEGTPTIPEGTPPGIQDAEAPRETPEAEEGTPTTAEGTPSEIQIEESPLETETPTEEPTPSQ